MLSDGRHRAAGPAELRSTALRVATPFRPAEQPSRARPRGVVAALVLAVAIVVVGTSVVIVSQDGPSAVPVIEASGNALTIPPPTQAAASVRATAVDIPSLKVHSDLVELGVDAGGVLVPPDSPSEAGWFAAGSLPGEPGPAVIAGHVDSHAGPGVFFTLKDMEVGDEITVTRSDGRTPTFRVVDVVVVPKDEFPTQKVYGPTPAPELRLITCGGEFDHSARRYLRNVVVSAVLADPG